MIRKGAEKVIKARFEDARFYYDQDRKTPSMVRLEGLRKVIYHDRLGTLYEKTQRITALAGYLASRCASAKAQDVHTAALLSKTDLISGVVREFPELQGIMGMYYARAEGYGDEIARGLAEQYMPAYSGAKVPETDIGAILSLADKMDNLASFFMLGQPPSGTEDPFALRRQAIGITSILRERRYEINLTEALTKALDPFGLTEPQTVITDLVRFFEQRFEPYFAGMGFPADSIGSVVHLLKDRPMHSLEGRLAALRDFRDHGDYPHFLLAIKRVNNISPREEMPLPDAAMYEHDEERGLHSEIERVRPEVERLLREGRYLDALTALGSVKEAINSFFDKVLVMDKREEIKRNRLALIKAVQVLSLQIADFTKLS
jgi:glycyl-tRNA synthetase beta chain